MRSVLRRAWKPLVPVALLLLVAFPGGEAEAAPLGPCGYLKITINGNTTTLPLVNSCTRETCVGISAGPFGTGIGGTGVEEYTCVNI